MRRWWTGAALSVALAATVGGCGDDNKDDLSRPAQEALQRAQQQAQESADAIEQAGERAGARAVAEAIRAALVAAELESGGQLRDVDRLREAVADLPGDPQVSGIDDADGDGLDDDGKVEVAVNGEQACLTVPDGEGDIDVAAGAC